MSYTKVNRDFIDRLAVAISHYEGYWITPQQASERKIKYPTIAQRNRNPGNIRTWTRDGKVYPTTDGFVDFLAWARSRFPNESDSVIMELAAAEGWRVLRTLLEKRFSSPITLEAFCVSYAPFSDGNNPSLYARFLARRLGVRHDQPLKLT